MSAKTALYNYLDNQLAKNNKPKRTNKKPEKEAVKKLVNYCAKNRIHIHRVEAKGRWSAEAGTYIKSETESGYPDLSGNTHFGVAVYIEAKAVGKRSNLSLKQYLFLEKKIKQGCFATVADTPEKLNIIYTGWLLFIKKGNHKGAEKFLLESLPKKKGIKEVLNNDEPIF